MPNNFKIHCDPNDRWNVCQKYINNCDPQFDFAWREAKASTFLEGDLLQNLDHVIITLLNKQLVDPYGKFTNNISIGRVDNLSMNKCPDSSLFQIANSGSPGLSGAGCFVNINEKFKFVGIILKRSKTKNLKRKETIKQNEAIVKKDTTSQTPNNACS